MSRASTPFPALSKTWMAVATGDAVIDGMPDHDLFDARAFAMNGAGGINRP
jgi:hypothetical protein